jgi:hypothetical protein
LLAVGKGALAASPALPSHASAAARTSSVTISITSTSGYTWGTVTARYAVGHRTTSHTCSSARCVLRVPQGATVHLSQVPTNSSTWPFKDWQISARNHTRLVMSPSVAIKVSGKTLVTAVYILHMM